MSVSPDHANDFPRRRIASLLASATEILCGLGLAERIVAISHECDFPPEILGLPRATRTLIDAAADSRAIDDEVRALSAAGAALYAVDEDLLAALQPELIVTQAQCDVCAVRLADVEAAVARSPALRQTQIVALNPQSLADVMNDIHRVGSAAGASRAAAEYCARLQARIDAVRERAQTGEPPRRVALIEWVEPLMLSGNWLPELVTLAGGEHALTAAGEHSPYVAWDDVRRYDPEVLIIAPCGFDLDRSWQEAQVLPQLAGWSDLAAVRSGCVFVADGNAYFNRSGPRLIDTLEIVAHLIEPERAPAPASSAHAWRRFNP